MDIIELMDENMDKFASQTFFYKYENSVYL